MNLGKILLALFLFLQFFGCKKEEIPLMVSSSTLMAKQPSQGLKAIQQNYDWKKPLYGRYFGTTKFESASGGGTSTNIVSGYVTLEPGNQIKCLNFAEYLPFDFTRDSLTGEIKGIAKIELSPGQFEYAFVNCVLTNSGIRIHGWYMSGCMDFDQSFEGIRQ